MEDIKKLPRPGNSPQELNKFAIKLQNIVCVLMNIDQQDYLKNPMLVRDIVEKLSPHVASRWCDYASEHERTGEAEIVLLSRFLMREADKTIRHLHPGAAVPTTPGRTTRQQQRDPAPTRPKREAVYATEEEEEKLTCVCCGGNHKVEKCFKLKKMALDKRWEWAREAGICFRCLKKGHRIKMCKSKTQCGVNKCTRPHHSVFHSEPAKTSTASSEDEASTSEAVMSVASPAATTNCRVLLKVCPVTISGPGGTCSTYALLDEGSTVSIIDHELAEKIGADGPTLPLRIRGVNSTQEEASSRVVQCQIKGADTDAAFTLKARTVRNLTLNTQAVPEDVANYKHLRNLKNITYGPARPGLLIGADNWHLIVSRQLRVGKRNQPAASRTRLGWVVHGTVPRKVITEDDASVLHTYVPEREEIGDELKNLVKSHFDIDALGVSAKKKERDEDRRAIDIFDRTARRVDGHFEVGLPWRHDDVQMPPNYSNALKRLRTIERKMDKDAVFKEEYTAQIENLCEKGYAERCSGSEEMSKKAWYLPHFAVRNPNKPEKIRLVFDAAARVHGTCLNDNLLEGPDLLVSLQGVLFRLRERPIAVTADIQEMFLRVKIQPEDQPAQMFLWRGADRRNPPVKYKMTSMIFGASSSPFLAHSVRNRNAEEFAETYPEAATAIMSSHYMDDYLDSFSTEEEAMKTAMEVRQIHLRASFNLRGWNSNSGRVLDNIPAELRARVPDVRLGSKIEHADKTLGLLWNSVRDELGFNTAMTRVPPEVRDGRRAPTKREMLSAVMSIYDPLGLISHYTIAAKILLQELWRTNIDWDEFVPEHSAEIFKLWLQDLSVVASLRLRRCYDGYEETTRRELHVCCDASQLAYAAAVYWRCERDDGTVEVTLAAAKAKVAPLKTISIPRLELQAALIGARLAAAVREGHRWKPERTVYWSDSRTVLHWIRHDARRYTPFVAHRLGEIAELTSPREWRWIPTELNVADDATRTDYGGGVFATSRWFTGPPFLREPERTWPREPPLPRDTEDEEVVATLTTGDGESPHLPQIEKFSSFTRLIRSTAYVLLFTEKCRRRATTLEVRHIDQATKLWIMKCQQDSFNEEIRRLRKNERIMKSSKLYPLDPVLVDNIIRVNGRIDAAHVTYSAQRPIILDGKHAFTRLLVEHEHRVAGHANNERVVNELRQRYWVIQLRPTVRAIARACQLCKVRRATPVVPVTGDLPPARLAERQRPFTYCGVDYFGPMIVTIGRRHEKRWGALFTCMTTRAVHLELAAGLTTDSAIMALRRMAARRGWPRVMYSDNGTNFRGADKELKKAYEEWLPLLQNYGVTKGMDWRFIPPGSPAWGGAWERLVRSVKNALTATLREKSPKEEVLSTLLAEAEYSLNARPLTHVAVEPADPEALTPNHFLLGSSSSLPLTGPCTDAGRSTWKSAQALADSFWRRWLVEYLPTIVPRGRSDQKERRLQQGDLVVVVDPTLPRNVWPRGVVERTYPGPDGNVRAADVRTSGGIFKRPVRKLAVLSIEEEAGSRGENVTDAEQTNIENIE